MAPPKDPKTENDPIKQALDVLVTELRFRVMDESDTRSYRLKIYVEDLKEPEVIVTIWNHKLYVEAYRREDLDSKPPKPRQVLSVNRPLPFNVLEENVTASFLPDAKAIIVEAPKSSIVPTALEVPSDDASSSSGSTPGSDSQYSPSKPQVFTKKLNDLTLRNYCPPPQDYMLRVKEVIDYYSTEGAQVDREKSESARKKRIKQPQSPADETEQMFKDTNGSNIPARPQLESDQYRNIISDTSMPSWYVPQHAKDADTKAAPDPSEKNAGNPEAPAAKSEVQAGIVPVETGASPASGQTQGNQP